MVVENIVVFSVCLENFCLQGLSGKWPFQCFQSVWKAHAQRFELAELRFASDSSMDSAALHEHLFLGSVGESERICLRKDHLPRVENSQMSKWHSPAALDLNDRSVHRKKSFNLGSVVIIM